MLGFYALVEVLSSRSSGVARQPVTFFIRYAHPTGRPSGAAQTTLCYSKKKSPKNAATLRRSLTTTGASRSVFCPAVPEGLSPSGIGGTFFVLHLHQALRPIFPLSEIVVLLFFSF